MPSLEPGPPALPVPKFSSSVLRPPDSRWEGSGPRPGVDGQATPPLRPSPWVDGQGAPALSPRCCESPQGAGACPSPSPWRGHSPLGSLTQTPRGPTTPRASPARGGPRGSLCCQLCLELRGASPNAWPSHPESGWGGSHQQGGHQPLTGPGVPGASSPQAGAAAWRGRGCPVGRPLSPLLRLSPWLPRPSSLTFPARLSLKKVNYLVN